MRPLSDATMQYGEAVTSALLGLDQCYRAEASDASDGLVVVNMATTHQPEPFADYSAGEARFAELERSAMTLPEPDRHRYYTQLCQSTRAFCRWRMGQLPFVDQIQAFLHVPPAPAADAELDDLRHAIHRLLGQIGYHGDLASQAAAWEAHNRVPADEVQGTLTDLLDQAWDRTAERIGIPADKTDGMRVATERAMPFSARCDYLARTIEINIDPILTRPGLKHLAVHEGYPGHYLQFKLREHAYATGSAPADGLLSVVNTASSAPFEGIADNGLRVIDWIESDDDRVSALMTRYRSGLGTAAAWRLHALHWTPQAVHDWLHANALIGGEGWVDNRMRFIAAPDRCALIWSYWHGEPAVQAQWEALPIAQRPAYLTFLYNRMHSLQTVSMFQ